MIEGLELQQQHTQFLMLGQNMKLWSDSASSRPNITLSLLQSVKSVLSFFN